MKPRLEASMAVLGGLIGMAIGFLIYLQSATFRSPSGTNQGGQPAGATRVLAGNNEESLSKPVAATDLSRAVKNVALAKLKNGLGERAAGIVNSHPLQEERTRIANELIEEEASYLRGVVPNGGNGGSELAPLSTDIFMSRLRTLRTFVEHTESPSIQANGYAMLAELRRRCETNPPSTLATSPTVDELLRDADERLLQVPKPWHPWLFSWGWLLPVLWTGVTGLVGVATSKFVEAVVVETGKRVVGSGVDKKKA